MEKPGEEGGWGFGISERGGGDREEGHRSSTFTPGAGGGGNQKQGLKEPLTCGWQNRKPRGKREVGEGKRYEKGEDRTESEWTGPDRAEKDRKPPHSPED